jgi:hypothetical protein
MSRNLTQSKVDKNRMQKAIVLEGGKLKMRRTTKRSRNDPPLRRFANPTGGRGYPGGTGEPYRSGERVSESGRCYKLVPGYQLAGVTAR